MASKEAQDQTTQRLFLDPGLPRANPTTAHWQLPPHSLSTIQSPSLSSETDILILGSGITGCSVAKHLLSLSPESSVTILEARTLCSGATGRNGGHIATHPVVDYGELVDVVGREEAVKIMKFRIGHLELIESEMTNLGQEAVEKSEVRRVESCVGLLDEATVEKIKALHKRMEDEVPELKGRVRVFERGEDGFEVFQMSGVAGIAVEPSGAIWPYRMVTAMFSHLINTYPTRLSIETGTPALSIIYSTESSHPYEITTPRGTIKAKQLVHCTNGYTGHLLPGLRGKIWPCKGHMSVQVPGEKFPRKGDRSWSVVYDTLGLDYVTQNVSTGELWYGGGLIRGKDAGLSAFGDSNDEVMDTMTRVHLHGAGPVFYGKENWGEEKGGEGRVKAEWSGIMGFTADGLPLVGKLPEIVTGRQGEREWICGGFNGYGMPNCWGSGKALAELIALGKIGDDFPESYLVGQARLDGMKGENAVEVFFGSE